MHAQRNLLFDMFTVKNLLTWRYSCHFTGDWMCKRYPMEFPLQTQLHSNISYQNACCASLRPKKHVRRSSRNTFQTLFWNLHTSACGLIGFKHLIYTLLPPVTSRSVIHVLNVRAHACRVRTRSLKHLYSTTSGQKLHREPLKAN